MIKVAIWRKHVLLIVRAGEQNVGGKKRQLKSQTENTFVLVHDALKQQQTEFFRPDDSKSSSPQAF